MNLAKLFETQKALDDRIIREKGLEGQDLLPMKVLALQVELGELANEWRGFKFWSNDQNPRRRKVDFTQEVNGFAKETNPLLEEYVDCLHFILSIGIEWSCDLKTHLWPSTERKMKTVIDQFNRVFNRSAFLDHGEDHWKHAFEYFVGLGEMLGFNADQIEQAYFAKNAENHSRQDRGY